MRQGLRLRDNERIRGGGGLSPADILKGIPGCKLLTFAENYTLTGGVVSLVASTVGPDFNQAIALRRPSIGLAALNGKAGLVFAGAHMLDGTVALDLSAGTSVTLFVVFKDTVAAGCLVLEQSANASINDGFFIATNDGAANRYAGAYRGTAGAFTRGYFARDNSVFSVDEWEFDISLPLADQVKNRINGAASVLVLGGGGLGVLGNDVPYVGARSGLIAPLTGTIVCFGAYQPKLGAADLATMRAALQTYTGLP